MESSIPIRPGSNGDRGDDVVRAFDRNRDRRVISGPISEPSNNVNEAKEDDRVIWNRDAEIMRGNAALSSSCARVKGKPRDSQKSEPITGIR